jgi:sigma-B regulation protein RsbU (phosphoserine phosphatase)
MKKERDYKEIHLSGFYLHNLGSNLLGIMVATMLNLFTPIGILKLENALVFAGRGWQFHLFVYSLTISLMGFLQCFIQHPISEAIKQDRREQKIQKPLLEKAQRRILNLPFLLAALSLMMWIFIPVVVHAVVHVFFLFHGGVVGKPSLFISFQAAMIGLVASTISFFLIEDYSRKQLIPFLFSKTKLLALPGTIKIPIRRRISALYLAGTFVPMIILVGTVILTLSKMEIRTISAAEYGREVLVFTMILCAIFIVVALRLNVLVRKSITNPLMKILAVVGRVRHADFTKRVQVASNDEIGVLSDAVNQMTEGLEERDQMRRSLDLAREVQQSLMPKTDPQVFGLEIAGKSIYCEKTGGDYYDYLDIDGQASKKISVVVGDVCGHGLPSALLMTTARALIRQRSALGGTIAEIVTDVNRQLALDVAESGSFMTLFYLTVNLANQSLHWVRAGHQPAIFYDPASNNLEELGGLGSALGVDGAYRFEENAKLSLAKGQIILVGTDGIWEARNSKGEMLGKETVCEIIRQYASAGATEILNAVVDFQQRFLNGVQPEDDVTLVVVKIDENLRESKIDHRSI